MTAATDTVMVNTPHHSLEHCELVALNRKSVRLRHPGPPGEVTYSLADGRPRELHAGRYRLHPLERERLASRAEEAPASRRSSVAEQITAAVLAPSWWAGWPAFREVTVWEPEIGEEGDGTSSWRQLRLDVVRWEPGRWHRRSGRPRILGVEVKSSRADFASDRKWTLLQRHVHGLAFAAPAGVIDLAELDAVSKRVGLYEWDGIELVCVRAPVFADTLPLETVIDTQRGLLLALSRPDR
jgi:hypothetical protein